jgi:FkbM family methyltransferase
VNRIKRLISSILGRFGYSIRNSQQISQVERLSEIAKRIEILSKSELCREISVSQANLIAHSSKSQLGQDVLALASKGLSSPGYFVEFGATNGVDLSNTFILEKDFGWEGILCEPATSWHDDLKRDRDCSIDTRCVFTTSKEHVSFTETKIGELSSISSFVKGDGHSPLRKRLSRYEVETVSLLDLLVEHQAPTFIDFLSVDTEGSEYEILKSFNFDAYSFGLICVEHNFTPNRAKILSLLESQGYRQIHKELSEWDDWFVPANSSIIS